jgi:hypothetical protein
MKTSVKIIHWTPRILCILSIAFISLFALDAFGHGKPILEQIGDFFMHLLPSFVLTGLLIFTWKKELWGGVLFLIIGLILTPLIYKMNFKMNQSALQSFGVVALITIPFIVIGLLFMLSSYLKKKSS